MKIGIVVASRGRAPLLLPFLDMVQSQSCLPCEIVLSVVSQEDVPDLSGIGIPVTVIEGPPGSCVQRNRGIDRLVSRTSLIVFLDDDFWMDRDYLFNLVQIFKEDDRIAGVTGKVIADGATSPGIPVTAAESLIALERERRPRGRTIKDVPDAYGCNMAFRTDRIGLVRFDERLALYGWQEDVDFSSQIGRRGRLVWTDAVWGVHLGTKLGKTSGIRFGYSQVVNPLYLLRKGNMPAQKAIKLIGKNLAANLVKSIAPEPYVDRRGRLRGNVIGFAHLALGRARPERVMDL